MASLMNYLLVIIRAFGNSKRNAPSKSMTSETLPNRHFQFSFISQHHLILCLHKEQSQAELPITTDTELQQINFTYPTTASELKLNKQNAEYKYKKDALN